MRCARPYSLTRSPDVMKLKVANGGAELAVSDENFGHVYNQSLVFQVVNAYLAAGRAGSKAQKTRAEVRGGGRKPHAQKVNLKMYRGAIRSMLSELVRQDRLVVTASFAVDKPKTKLLLAQLKSLALEDVLIILEAGGG